MTSGTSSKPKSTTKVSWILVSGIAFLLCIAASVVLIFFGKRLEDLGITGNIYYIVLIPLGFSCAAFLAGAMKSYASFKSNATMPYGELNLTGPVVIFVLVVGGGFIMPNFMKKEQFELKVRIVSDDKATNLFNDGKIVLYIGKEPKTVSIHDGEATFYNIPSTYHDKEVTILPEIEDYQLAGPDKILISKNEDYVDVKVARTKQSLVTEVRGSIMNERNAPVKNAFINFASGTATCYTNKDGDFVLTVPFPSGKKIPLKIVVDSITKFNEDVTISSSTPINLKLNLKP